MNQTERDARVEEEVEEEDCEVGDEEFWPLSEKKPFFNIIMCKSYVKPSCIMGFPSRIHSKLASKSEKTVPTLMKYRGKTWKATFSVNHNKLDSNSWKKFVSDNNLKIGDACVFQILHSSSSKLVLRLQILRGDIPSQILRRTSGETSNSPILVD